jgi:1-acyl-sn-glycerol-3-phosphate acyltransferase
MFYWIIKSLAWPLRKFYFRIEARGLQHLPGEGPAILVANHASYLDAGVLGSVLPRKIHFVVLATMHKMWRFRWFYSGMETIPVSRGAGDHAPIRRSLQVLRAGGVLGIFPEGGRTYDGELRAPREGAALLAKMSGAAVVPAGIQGAYESMPRGRFWPRPRKIRVRLGAPLRFPVSDGRDRQAEREALKRFSVEIMEAIRTLVAPAVAPEETR